jgi:hypothetical protein
MPATASIPDAAKAIWSFNQADGTTQSASVLASQRLESGAAVFLIAWEAANALAVPTVPAQVCRTLPCPPIARYAMSAVRSVEQSETSTTVAVVVTGSASIARMTDSRQRPRSASSLRAGIRIATSNGVNITPAPRTQAGNRHDAGTRSS